MAVSFQVTFDCADPQAQSRFWASALDYIEQPPPPGYSDWPLVMLRLAEVDLARLEELVVDAWRMRAPSDLVEGGGSEPRR